MAARSKMAARSSPQPGGKSAASLPVLKGSIPPVGLNRKLLVLKGSMPIGLKLPRDYPFKTWRRMGEGFAHANTALQWLLGDWWNYGWHRYGDRVQEVERWGDGGLSFQTCENCGWVCTEFATSRRREALSFSHHAEVAGLKLAEADRLLDWAMEDPTNLRSTRELREEVRRLRDEAELEEARRRAAAEQANERRRAAPEQTGAPQRLAGTSVGGGETVVPFSKRQTTCDETEQKSPDGGDILNLAEHFREDWDRVWQAVHTINAVRWPSSVADGRHDCSPLEATRAIGTAIKKLEQVKWGCLRNK
jgi:hypothetical protein